MSEQNETDELIKNREKTGLISGIVGIFLNFLLFTVKLTAGLVSKSISVIADALNNLSDFVSSFVTLIGFKISAKKADDEHPFGHGRMEYIAGLIVSFMIILVGTELFITSIKSIKNPRTLESSIFTVLVLCFSVAVKSIMFFYNMHFSRKIKSPALKATAMDSLSDVFSTLVVLFSVVIARVFPQISFPFDAVAGIIVSLFIIWNGISSAKETVNPLLGSPADKEIVSDIEKIVLSYYPICAVHDMLIHEYGPSSFMISLHAEVPGDMNIFDLHKAIDDAENAVFEKYHCIVTIHMDPVDFKNPEIIWLRDYLKKSAIEIDEKLTVHDVQLVKCGEKFKVIFDALRPRGCKLSDEEIKNKFCEKINRFNPDYETQIKIDNAFY